MAANRDSILQNLKTTLQGINGTGSYKTEVTTVSIAPAGTVIQTPLVAAGTVITIVPRSESYERRENGNRYRVTLDVILHVVLSDVTHDLAETKLSNTIDDIIYATHIDPYRGTTSGVRNATVTHITNTDPEEYIVDRRIMSFVLTLQCVYHRGPGAS